MASGGYEIPNEMRDLAEKSVEQARKAFDGFMEAAHKAAATAEQHAADAERNVRATADSAVSYAEANVAASFAFAQKLVRAKSIEEMMAIQAEFARGQVEALSRQVETLTKARKA
ncbi:phasin family protein [Methylopila turkensis]|uniref:Phasin n=1 Tax=Methylopila turkensis TaxID=1437816 RepID=A0A9W6JNM8_9HYPH|nr:phasin family protein [Methylopila turkensis]GLK80422.1 phasin [Methylopila turkensis]